MAYSDLFILGSGSEELAIRTEADAANVQITGLARALVNKNTKIDRKRRKK